MTARSRFYREVTVERAAVLLDGKPSRTPAGAFLVVPNSALAEAIAEEWRRQEKIIRAETMYLTKLANTAIDRVAVDRELVAGQILDIAKSDLVCYRAAYPDSLVSRQEEVWNPLLEWVLSRHRVILLRSTGTVFIKQPPEGIQLFYNKIISCSNFTLAGLHTAAVLCGSAVIALALFEGHLNAEEAFAAAELDALYQAERWGQDAEAHKHSQEKLAELTEIARYFSLLKS